MFFRKKAWLRKEFDEKLLTQLTNAKSEWNHDKALVDKSFDPFGEIELQEKISGAKYFFLLIEAKKRNLQILK